LENHDKNTKRKIEELGTDKEQVPSIFRSAPEPTAGNEGEQRIVDLNGTYYLYRKIEGTWKKIQWT